MKQFRKRFLAALLSFVMVFLSMSDIFTAHAALPAVVDDPNIVSSITYDDVATAARGNRDFYVGEEVRRVHIQSCICLRKYLETI